jgi:hypothetical protein
VTSRHVHWFFVVLFAAVAICAVCGDFMFLAAVSCFQTGFYSALLTATLPVPEAQTVRAEVTAEPKE